MTPDDENAEAAEPEPRESAKDDEAGAEPGTAEVGTTEPRTPEEGAAEAAEAVDLTGAAGGGDVAAAGEPTGARSAAGRAADNATAAVEETAEDAAQLIRDLQDIPFGTILMILFGTWLAVGVLRRVFPYLADRSPTKLRLALLGAVPVLRLVLLVTAVLWTVPLIFNVTFQNFLVIAGAASVAIGFAFKDYASSIIAGIVALVERPYRPGDWVKLGDDYGEVVLVGMRAVRLNTPDDDIITVPHDRIWTDNIANANDGARTLQCVADFHVRPGHDAAAVRAVLSDVAKTSAYLDWSRPVAVVVANHPWGAHYKVRAYPFDMRDQFRFKADLTARGKAALTMLGAEETAAGFAASD